MNDDRCDEHLQAVDAAGKNKYEAAGQFWNFPIGHDTTYDVKQFVSSDRFTVISAAGAAFNGDTAALQAAYTEIRTHFRNNSSASDADVPRLVSEGQEAMDFLRTAVVQGQLNERGNYGELPVNSHHQHVHLALYILQMRIHNCGIYFSSENVVAGACPQTAYTVVQPYEIFQTKRKSTFVNRAK